VVGAIVTVAVVVGVGSDVVVAALVGGEVVGGDVACVDGGDVDTSLEGDVEALGVDDRAVSVLSSLQPAASKNNTTGMAATAVSRLLMGLLLAGSR